MAVVPPDPQPPAATTEARETLRSIAARETAACGATAAAAVAVAAAAASAAAVAATAAAEVASACRAGHREIQLGRATA